MKEEILNKKENKKKKTVCFSIPCFNEEKNIEPITEGILSLFKEKSLKKYKVIIQFIDNNSTDNTRNEIRNMCKKHKDVRAIFNAKNFPMSSGYYGILQTTGDCTIAIPCDFQVPLSVIPELIKKWESGKSIVILRKISTKSEKGMFFVRKLFYKLSDIFTETKVISGFNGCGLYEKKFIDVCRDTNDNVASFIQMVNVLGYNMDEILYEEQKRRSGKSKNNLSALISIAIDRFISMSNFGPRLATVFGFFMSLISFIIGMVYFVLKLMFWKNFPAGTAPILFGVYFLGSVQIFMIGLVGEYIIKVNQRVMKRPLVIEEERINFF